MARNSSTQPSPPERPPDVLQWNCRALRQSATELNELFRLTGQPAALLLQETRGTEPGVTATMGTFSLPLSTPGITGGSKTRLSKLRPQFSYGVTSRRHRSTRRPTAPQCRK
ncbi:hypothetical protein HPB48_001524 [Haemaphysalis longicornis]|uniref:Uncharacterized protein n=1 Tax=Haemaphysalis longicornis TaxID=44386 RepID=A0A9J6GQB3_HAELO|nr:hypothetical protein HPB48_001524 [Haemaphysalis longicornis]